MMIEQELRNYFRYSIVDKVSVNYCYLRANQSHKKFIQVWHEIN